MIHNFEPEVAVEVGVNSAIIYQNIVYWTLKNHANQKNIHDGSVWTYNSNSAFRELFPYLTEKQIRTALGKLVNAGMIAKGNYNKNHYDRTNWYGISIGRLGLLHLPSAANHTAPSGRPIPDNKHSYKPDRVKATIPTPEEVTQYADEKGLNLDGFHDYYESNGWMVGKNKMKKWKSAASGWSKRQEQYGNKKPADKSLTMDEQMFGKGGI